MSVKLAKELIKSQGYALLKRLYITSITDPTIDDEYEGGCKPGAKAIIYAINLDLYEAKRLCDEYVAQGARACWTEEMKWYNELPDQFVVNPTIRKTPVLHPVMAYR
jgi:hypothetical protein